MNNVLPAGFATISRPGGVGSVAWPVAPVAEPRGVHANVGGRSSLHMADRQGVVAPSLFHREIFAGRDPNARVPLEGDQVAGVVL